ncbi:hypothetical protein N8072_00925 [bacterium]|nr:hypothetical protein [bacterium]MDB4128742.1 hypothetical protein [bacterium]MDC1257223.1 hypothetical protein [bacterium]
MGGLSIKTEMSAIDTKNRAWYNSLTDEEKKKVSPWMLMRYASSVKHDITEFEEHYLEWTNELVNVHFNTLRHHPELQMQLLQVVGIGKNQFHPWLAPGKRGKSDKMVELVAGKYPHLNDDEINIYLNTLTTKQTKDLQEDLSEKKKRNRK